MSKIIGIDLGTTNSCVSVMQGGKPVIIVNNEGHRITPSVVAYKDGSRLVGEQARRQAVTNPETIFSVKSRMGYSTKIPLNGNEYSPQEISAMILQYLKKQAEDYLGEEVTKAVITVPAYFNDSQRQATKDAGRIAGLHVERIINEPTAAAVAYGLDKTTHKQNILVYDFGGGTFDVSVLEMENGFYEVLSTAGSDNLGGDDIDNVLINYILDYFYDLHEIALKKNLEAMGRLRDAVESAKRNLSTTSITTISLPFLDFKDGSPLHLELDLTRAKFEELISDLINRTIEPMERAIKDSRLNKKEIDKVLLVGGSTRIPAVRELVERITGKAPHKDVNPDEAVSLGAAIQGGILSGEVSDLVLIDVAPLSLGIETSGGIMTKLIERNTTIPATNSQVFSTATDGQESVSIKVYQGERALAKDNHLLGTFVLSGIPQAKKGVPQIEVTFNIDGNGLVSVEAKDKKTGRTQIVVIEGTGGLSPEDIARMVEEAENFAKEDENTNTLVLAKNDLDRMRVELSNTREHFINVLTEEEFENLSSDFNNLEIAIKEKNYPVIKGLNENLSYSFGKHLVSVYKHIEKINSDKQK